MNNTHIQWCDYSANVIKYRDEDGKSVWACVKVSDGCKNCRKPLTHSRGLEYCEGCGYETPESERRPVVIPNDNDREETRMEPVIQSADQLAAACAARVAEIDRDLAKADVVVRKLRDEKARLGKVVALLTGEAKATKPVKLVRDAMTRCGRSWAAREGRG